jgi:hypothetical protein
MSISTGSSEFDASCYFLFFLPLLLFLLLLIFFVCVQFFFILKFEYRELAFSSIIGGESTHSGDGAAWENISTEDLIHDELTTGGKARFDVLSFWHISSSAPGSVGKLGYSPLYSPSTSSAPASLQSSSAALLFASRVKNFSAQRARRFGILAMPDRALEKQLF